MNVCAKFRSALLRIKKALGIYRGLITTTTTRVAFWDPPAGSKNSQLRIYRANNDVTSSEYKYTICRVEPLMMMLRDGE